MDLPSRGLKYLMLGFFLLAVGTMSATGINAFMHTPFGIVADVKLLDFFRAISCGRFLQTTQNSCIAMPSDSMARRSRSGTRESREIVQDNRLDKHAR